MNANKVITAKIKRVFKYFIVSFVLISAPFFYGLIVSLNIGYPQQPDGHIIKGLFISLAFAALFSFIGSFQRRTQRMAGILIAIICLLLLFKSDFLY